MSEASQRSQSLGIEDEQRLIEVLDAFEAEWRSGQKPQRDAWLQRVEPHLREPLARDLERIEAELQRSTRTVDSTAALGAAARPVGVGAAAETAELLRVRLRVAAIILVTAVGLFFLRSLMFPPSWVGNGVRVAVILIAAWMIWRLRPGTANSLTALRRFELLLLAVVACHTLTFQFLETVLAARQGDAVTLNGAMLFGYANWCVIHLAYGVLIPNPWPRAARILALCAAAPFLLTYATDLYAGADAGLVREEYRFAGALLSCVAAGAAVASAYTVAHLRSELDRARRFGPYRLVKRLGRGGMGEVYLAEHQLLKRPSAIKLIRPGYDSDEEAIRRFEREVQATALLAHWNTVEIFDYGRTDDGAFYYVMEYLEGQSLQQLVERHGRLPSARVVYLLRQLCGALVEAHAAGLIHRDIKPANIFAARRGSQTDVAKLLDFGLVHELAVLDSPPEPPESKANRASADSAAPMPSGRPERFVGTPRFLAPEQATPDAEVDPRTDLYSLGATAYYLLTGRAPFEYKRAAECIAAHMREPPQSPAKFVDGIDPDLEAIVLRCLRKERSERFASAAEMDAALAACACAREWTAEKARAWWAEQGEVE